MTNIFWLTTFKTIFQRLLFEANIKTFSKFLFWVNIGNILEISVFGKYKNIYRFLYKLG